MNSRQLNDLLKRISADHKLQRTEDTSLLSEERYPVDLSPLFESLTKPTSLQDAISLLKWEPIVQNPVTLWISLPTSAQRQNRTTCARLCSSPQILIAPGKKYIIKIGRTRSRLSVLVRYRRWR